ncbi:hypothetical protein DICSQDRAFT_130855 [Dichomitus squalens LYAD-421 SS1]|uniref:Uncharacterized protein n=1 Tax=Dichomitus squalens TaxID=114155 RepID=A0A4Q9N7G9_9APHY|nr:uncharacterized protein DICSQDRAFT_130855 [Dichomitus squalens LYAD-421 SS1]EJF66608.1 hypothetical protein DICSQDRAFT_130855 [Dichomitus squalens LYAD-421 SS1]TBU35141.1 hypothetical protein BD311DRAFT_773292 [Dichomitus squalens]TBU64963.1 hypothetical protein BD310DRAFT_954457 [Dichomitus squalens]
MVSADELCALQEENLQIRSQIADAKANLHHIDGNPQSTANHNEQLSQLSEEAAQRDAEYARSRERLSAKIEAMRGKCKAEKEMGSKLRESISEAETQVSDIERMNEEQSGRLQDLRDDLTRAQGSAVPFDFCAFLGDVGGETGAPPTVSVPAPQSALVLPEAVTSLCAPGGFLAKKRQEVILSSTRAGSRCLVLAPTHLYNPKSNNSEGGWQVTERVSQPPENTELFYRENTTHWSYLGTFQFVAQEERSLQDFGRMAKEAMQVIRDNTTLFPEMIPPILKGLIRNMYDCGLLKVTYTAWRRVGFNEGLADALRATFQPPRLIGESTVIPVPKPGSWLNHRVPTKRDREEDLGVGSHKKSKGA